MARVTWSCNTASNKVTVKNKCFVTPSDMLSQHFSWQHTFDSQCFCFYWGFFCPLFQRVIIFIGDIPHSSLKKHECPIFSKSRAEKHHQGVPEWAVRLYASWQHYLKARGRKHTKITRATSLKTRGETSDLTWTRNYHTMCSAYPTWQQLLDDPVEAIWCVSD